MQFVQAKPITHALFTLHEVGKSNPSMIIYRSVRYSLVDAFIHRTADRWTVSGWLISPPGVAQMEACTGIFGAPARRVPCLCTHSVVGKEGEKNGMTLKDLDRQKNICRQRRGIHAIPVLYLPQ